MEYKFGDRVIPFEPLGAAVTANSYPDLLFTAGGKTAKAGGKANFRVRLMRNGVVLKKWKERVEYTPAGGTSYGNMFDSLLQKRDDIETGRLEVIFEVDSEAGYKLLGLNTAQILDRPPLNGIVVGYDAGDGITGVFVVLVMM